MSEAPQPVDKKVGSVFDLPKKSYEIVKKNWKLFAVVNAFAIFSAIVGIFHKSEQYGPRRGTGAGDFSGISSGYEIAGTLGLGLVIALLFLLLAFFLYTMSVSLELRTSKGEKPELKQIFDDGKKYFLPLLGLTILSALIVLVGLILLIVPGIIAITKLIMSPYQMLEKNLGVTDAMKASNELSKGNGTKIWAAIGVMILVGLVSGIVGSIPVIGGLIGTALTIAFSLVLVLRYRELQKA